MADEIAKISSLGRQYGKDMSRGWIVCTAIVSVLLLVSLGFNWYQATREHEVIISNDATFDNSDYNIHTVSKG